MGLHMDLQIPYYRMKGVQVNELMRLVHEFLRDRFSVGTKRTRRCSSYRPQSPGTFLHAEPFRGVDLCAIFLGNAQLCGELCDKVVQHFVHCI